MRVILVFGGFRKEIKIPDSKAFQPLVIPHPLEKDATLNLLSENAPIKFKRMTFEYSRQLEGDLLEYKFVREE